MIDYDEIARVLRKLDKESETVSIPIMLASVGVKEEGAFRASQQRALRAYLISRGRELPRATEPVMVQHPPEDQREIMMLAAVWIDGLITGLELSVTPPDDQHRRSSA